jgi:hypothetical protein
MYQKKYWPNVPLLMSLIGNSNAISDSSIEMIIYREKLIKPTHRNQHQSVSYMTYSYYYRSL